MILRIYGINWLVFITESVYLQMGKNYIIYIIELQLMFQRVKQVNCDANRRWEDNIKSDPEE